MNLSFILFFVYYYNSNLIQIYILKALTINRLFLKEKRNLINLIGMISNRYLKKQRKIFWKLYNIIKNNPGGVVNNWFQ